MYPYVHSLIEGVHFGYQLLYLLDASHVHHPVLHALGLSMARVSAKDLVGLQGGGGGRLCGGGWRKGLGYRLAGGGRRPACLPASPISRGIYTEGIYHRYDWGQIRDTVLL